MAEAVLSDMSAVKALQHAFHKSDAKDAYWGTLHLTLGPKGLEVLGLVESRAMHARLALGPQAFESLPEETASVDCRAHRFTGLLTALSEKVVQDEPLALRIDIDRGLRMTLDLDRGITANRFSGPEESAISELPPSPSFAGAAEAAQIPSDALWTLPRLLGGLEDLEVMTLALEPATKGPLGRLILRPSSPRVDASASIPVGVTGAGASSTYSFILEEIGSFGSPAKGVGATNLALKLRDRSMMRFTYALANATMDYWAYFIDPS